MKIDGIAKLQHLLQTMAFCLAIATFQAAFAPERPYGPPVAYSLGIGLASWALIDFGRHLFPSAADTGWPRGWVNLVFVPGALVAGFLAGNRIGDAVCRYYGWYDAHVREMAGAQGTSLLVSAIAGLGITYYFYAKNKGAYLERQMGEARSHASEARLKLLESQLEPHMLFNTLANLRALIAADPPRAQQMLDQLIAYLRATLDASRATLHPLQAEFDRLRDYFGLMSVRMGPRLQHSLALPPALARHPVPTLLLQPLVENAIKHGLEPKVGGGRIAVSARAEAGQLVLCVEDDGVGSPALPEHAGAAAVTAQAGIQSFPSGSTGFGLAQVRERLAAVYEGKASLHLTCTPDAGTRAVIRLPLQA